MDTDRRRSKPANRWRQRRSRGSWFLNLTASTLATVIGIGLTFGIDGCVQRRKESEVRRKSMLQAVDNLGERFDETQQWIDKLLAQNNLYEYADSLYSAGANLPDSICEQFSNTMLYVKVSAFDHDFEKIFRGSYQLWQLQTRSDSLVYYISQCYDGLNVVENTCETLTENMVEQIGIINADKHFHRLSARQWTETLLSDSRFQYYMSIRWGKAYIADRILQRAKEDYDKNVLPRCAELKADRPDEDK